MQLLRGWQALGLFWLGALFATSTGAAVLQFLGPPVDFSPSVAALVGSAGKTSDFVAPLALRTVAVPDDTAVDAAPVTPNPAEVQAAPASPEEPEPVANLDTPAVIEPDQATTVPIARPTQDMVPTVVTRRQLRIVRDSRFCTRAECTNWSLLFSGSKRSQPAIVDMSKLRLAPALRQAAEKGEIELIVDASERHETLNGRPVVIYLATNLAGVTPHVEKSRLELLPLPIPGSQ